jgi:hypothetical protein
MSTIYDRAVRALQRTNPELDGNGHPLGYYCGGPERRCEHRACRAVSELAEDGLLGYGGSAIPEQPRPAPATGVEHYREAERLAEIAQRHTTEHPGDMRIAEVTAATAQVHATLAGAAAQAMSQVARMMGDDEQVTAWAWAIGWRDPAEVDGTTLTSHLADAIAPTYQNTPAGHPLLWADAERIAAELTKRGLAVVQRTP